MGGKRSRRTEKKGTTSPSGGTHSSRQITKNYSGMGALLDKKSKTKEEQGAAKKGKKLPVPQENIPEGHEPNRRGVSPAKGASRTEKGGVNGFTGLALTTSNKKKKGTTNHRKRRWREEQRKHYSLRCASHTTVAVEEEGESEGVRARERRIVQETKRNQKRPLTSWNIVRMR